MKLVPRGSILGSLLELWAVPWLFVPEKRITLLKQQVDRIESGTDLGPASPRG